MHVQAGEFLALSNRLDNDVNWQSTDPAWVGKASMSLHHKFLVPSSLQDGRFALNAACFRPEHLPKVVAMQHVATVWAMRNWGLAREEVGLFFHCHLWHSINHLHMHIVDLRNTGPSFAAQSHKNLPVSAGVCFEAPD